MKSRFITVLSMALLLLFCALAAAEQSELKPRGMAGFKYRGLTPADMTSLKLANTTGVLVVQVFPQTPAERAGLKAGDILKKYDDYEIKDDSSFMDINRRYYAGDKINVTLERNGKPVNVILELAAFPLEQSPGLKLEYGYFESQGAQLRACVVSPWESEEAQLPAVLIVSALNSPRLASLPGYYDMSGELAKDLAKAGFRVMRFELRGFGDSGGEDYRDTDFNTEVRDNLAALDYLMSRKDVNPRKVFVFGHSTGGTVAAVLAGQRPVAGLIASCTIGRTFYERMVDTLRLQGQLAKESLLALDALIKDYLFLTIGLAEGDSLAAIQQRHPGVAKLVNNSGRLMDDRNAEYWRQQVTLNLAEVYCQVTCPVLIVYAASDFLTQSACHNNIREILGASGNTRADLIIIPNLDHRYAYARDFQESYDNYQSGKFSKNPAAAQAIVDWLDFQLKNASGSPLPK